MFKQLNNELAEAMRAIFNNPRYKSDTRRNRRCVDTWKMVCQSYEDKCKSSTELNMLYFVMGALNYHLYPLTKDEAMGYIDFVLSIVKIVEV